VNSFAEENYLKAIFKLALSTNEAATTNQIAAIVNTKAATVTDMLKKLAEKKLIIYNKYKGVTLSNAGKKIAISVVRKHRLWEVFLVEKLNFKWDEVHEIAEQLEHIQSDELINELDKFLGFPKYDPHGDPIPDKNGKISVSKSMPLSGMKQKAKYHFTGVEDHSKEFLRYISKAGIKLGDIIQLKEINEYDKSILVNVKNRQLFLSAEAAKNILVEKV
jgi:DtxR family transcriptional regulator, Mn-dependent transcriptional regulator